MTALNPLDSAQAAVAVADAPADVRATFLKKVYGLLTLSILMFAGTLWAFGNVPAVREPFMAFWDWMRGLGGWGMLVYIGLQFAGFYTVRATARIRHVNVVVMLLFAVMWALLLGPLVLYAANAAPSVLNQASGLTAIIFLGLTAFAFTSGKDFSFMRGALYLGMFALLGIGLVGAMAGFDLSLLISAGGVLVFSGFVLYDTSKILHHYPEDMAPAAAAELFSSVVILFSYVLRLLLSMASDD